MDARQEHFKELMNNIKGLQMNAPHLYDQIYAYRKNAKNEGLIDSMRVTKEYRDGRNDPSNIQTKYERQLAHRKLFNMGKYRALERRILKSNDEYLVDMDTFDNWCVIVVTGNK